MAGALAYSLLRPFGLDYLRSYFLTAALVTLLTSALCTAIATVLLYRMVLDWTSSAGWALAAALGYGLGTTAWPYTGTLHHDAMAAALLFIGFYFAGKRPLASGTFLGLALTTSLLAWVVTAIVAVYVLLRREQTHRDRGLFVAGVMIGIAPLVFYNAVSFGNPFGQAVFVGRHAMFLPAGIDARSAALLWEYVRLLVGYTPITLLGLIGAWFLPAALRRERNLLFVLAAAHLAFVVVVHADGACQYGPRMLLPILPFAALGVAGFATLKRRALAAAVVAVIASISAGMNLLGALYGTHFCPHDRYAVERYLAAAREGVGFSLPLLGPLGAPRGEASRESDRQRASFLLLEASAAVARDDLDQARRLVDAAETLAPDVVREALGPSRN